MQDSRVLGTGFLISPSHAITAAHHVLDRPAEVLLSDGAEGVPARVAEVRPEAGVALIEVDGPGFPAASVPDTDRCRSGDPWAAPYAELSGSVLEATTAVLRLQADRPGDGYVGGPVERHLPGTDPTLVGVLVEREPAGPELLAAPVGAALGRPATADPLLAHLRDKAESGYLDAPLGCVAPAAEEDFR